ncbi:hypothetical protein KCU61_g8024, partial [Aureobasidium melanogenum]
MSEASPKPGVYWKEHTKKSVITAVARLIGDPQRQASFWGSMKEHFTTCRNLPEFLQKFDQHGHHLDEFKVIQALLNRYGDDDDDMINSWLIFDILPRLQESHARSQALESTVDIITKTFSAFIRDVSDALPEAHGMPSITMHQARLNRLSTTLQKYREAFGCNNNNHTPQSSKRPGEAFEDSNEDDRCTVLTKRIEALEKIVQENRDNMEAHQPFVMVEESAETARSQTMQEAAQEPPSEFAALSDASTSSTCTLTPASISEMKEISKISRLTIDRLW